MIRLRMSRPSLSVPSRCCALPPSCHTGGFRRLASEPRSGSYGATCGASAAGITSRKARMEIGTSGYFRACRSTWATLGAAYHGSVRTVTVAMGGLRRRQLLAIPDAGVEIRVEDVYQQVREDEDPREHDDHRLHYLEVTGAHRVDDEQP